MEVYGRIDPSPAVGCIVVVKFFLNNDKISRNEIITRSLGKIGVVNSLHDGSSPQNAEFWKCEVLRETHVGCNKGCFVLAPLERLEEETITRLLPGLYTETMHSGILIIKPKKLGHHWILPLIHRQCIKDVYAVIVDVGGSKV
jgi:hypothetical protein